MKKRFFAGLFFVFLGMCFTPLHAAVVSKPVMLGIADGKSQVLRLTQLSIDVRISGFVAETRMTMTFYNPYNPDMEGQLQFPLPEGAFVSGYALDVNGKMVDGVVVEKEKARMVFEEIERRGVDPGLVEWVKGNNFKTRVYPIRHDTSRTVMVRFVSELGKRDGQYYYYLPLAYKQKVAQYSLTVTGDYSLPKIEKQNYLLSEDLRFPIATIHGEKAQVVESPAEGLYYFSLHDFQTGAAKRTDEPAITPKRICILWDNSSSNGTNDHAQEFQLLKKYFARQSSVEVELKVFNCIIRSVGRFIVKNGDVKSLLKAIKHLPYDGGTTMGVISPSAQELQPDFYLLFSDGNHNFGQETPRGFHVPVYVFSSFPDANFPLLRYIASRTGGRFFNLTQQANSEILPAIGRPSYTLLKVESLPGTISETYPSVGQPVSDIFSLTGKLLKEEATITLHFGIGDKTLKKTTFQVSRQKAKKGELLQTYWAQKKIEELLVFPKRHRKLLEHMGKTYGLVTPGTSLMVLERASDYIRYKITPPASLPQDVREEYDRLFKKEKEKIAESQDKKLKKLAAVISQWEAFVKWWGRDFKPKATPEPAPVATSASRALMLLESRQFDPSRDLVSSTPPVSTGQNVYASLSGQVILEDGYPIPGVTVTLQSENSTLPTHSELVTSEQGNYRFNTVPAGVYSLKFKLEGFKVYLYNNIRIDAGQQMMLRPLVMEVGELREEIVVVARAPLVDVRRSSTAVNISAEALYRLRKAIVFGVAPEMAIKEWKPDTPYLKLLESTGKTNAYSTYLKQKEQYGTAPGFYLDCAGYFFKQGLRQRALTVLSNIAEINMDDVAMLRILGHRLAQLGYLNLSADIFKQVVELKPEEPQTYRDLALVMEQQGLYRQAAAMLYKIVVESWNLRFNGIEMIALVELNHVIHTAQKKGITIKTSHIDPRLIQLLDMDVRVVLTWDTDMSDMDLWVIEPNGEKAYYSNNRTAIGGHLSNDFTQGLGPEEYFVKRAIPGLFKIKANYYGTTSPKIIAPVTLHVDIFTNYGRKNEKRQALTLQLETRKDVYDVGDVLFEKNTTD